MQLDKNQQVFFDLLRAGLWEKEIPLAQYNNIDFSVIMKMAGEQSVVGLISAGLEQVKDVKIPQEWILQFIGSTLQIEMRNKEMNEFVAQLISKLWNQDIYALLVKGQGIAQCYKKPLWRSCGDVDLFLDHKNYFKAQKFLVPIAQDVEKENPENLHQAMTINKWTVELHGTLRSHLGSRIDNIIDDVQEDTFYNKQVRIWRNGNTDVPLPAPDNDVIFVFTHILQHFFHGGIGLRQICDWCRLLWTYREKIDTEMLEGRLRRMGIISHWKAFAVLAVDTLGIPVEAMPLYSSDRKWSQKAERIRYLVLESGNFGHGRDMSYKQKYPKIIEYLISFWVYSKYSIQQFVVFPLDAIKGWKRVVMMGMKAKTKNNLG